MPMDSETVQQLEKIAKAIRALEGKQLPLSVGLMLSKALSAIAEYCAPGEV